MAIICYSWFLTFDLVGDLSCLQAIACSSSSLPFMLYVPLGCGCEGRLLTPKAAQIDVIGPKLCFRFLDRGVTPGKMYTF